MLNTEVTSDINIVLQLNQKEYIWDIQSNNNMEHL